MIKSNIDTHFNHQFVKIKFFNDHVFIADYTNQTQTSLLKRGVEFFSPTYPADIDYFTIINNIKLEVNGIDFDNSSFICGNGNSRSQCECVFFPHNSSNDSWILFCELKYSYLPTNNRHNLIKAIKQVYKSRYYYFQRGIISSSNTSYLIASLPMQTEPFPNFIIPQPMLTKLKLNKNIVLRLKNTVEILDDKTIAV